MSELVPGEAELDRTALVRRVVELTCERDAALAEASAERERTSAAMQQCDHLASEILTERKRHARELADGREMHATLLARARQEQQELGHRLAHATQTIANMERSRFWKMRMISVRIRRMVGLKV